MQGNSRGTYGTWWKVTGEFRGMQRMQGMPGEHKAVDVKMPGECRGMQGNAR